MLAAIFMLLLQDASEPPRTINGAVLGTVERFTDHGPATVCMRDLVLRPAAGQSIQLAYSGIHDGRVRLVLENGEVAEFAEGESFVDQRQPGQAPLERLGNMAVYLVADNGPEVRYQLEESNAPDGTRPTRVFVSGNALAGNRADIAMFNIASFEEPAAVQCDRRYNYGWGVLFDGEPFSIRAAPEATPAVD